jgi:hypothetical protein
MAIGEREQCTNLVKVKHQIQLTNIPEERIQHLYEEMNSLQIRQFVIRCIYCRTKEKTRISPIHHLQGPELDKVRLVLLVSRCDQSVDFAFELDLFLVAVWSVPFC